jgi:hypothetical protein
VARRPRVLILVMDVVGTVTQGQTDRNVDGQKEKKSEDRKNMTEIDM